MTKNNELNLLSIQAIIQKSQFSRAYHNIPNDLKKIVLDEMISKDNENRKYHKVSQIKTKPEFYPSKHSLQSLPSYSGSHRGSQQIAPPLSKKEKRTASLNTSKKMSKQVQNKPSTCRSVKKLKSNIKKNRHSLHQTNDNNHKFITIENQPKQTTNQDQQNICQPAQNIPNNNENYKIRNKLSRYQFQIPISQGTSSKIRQSLSNKLLQGQLYSYNQNKSINDSKNKSIQSRKKKKTLMTEQQECIKFEITQQDYQIQKQRLQQKMKQFQEHQQHQNINKKVKNKQNSPKIPNYIIQAVSKQHKQVYAPKRLQIKLTEFSPDKIITPKQKLNKQPKSVPNIQRIMGYRKKKTQQSELQPQANLIKLINQKQRYTTRQNLNQHKKQCIKTKTGRLTAPKRQPRRKKYIVEQNVCGWQVKDQPMFFDNY